MLQLTLTFDKDPTAGEMAERMKRLGMALTAGSGATEAVSNGKPGRKAAAPVEAEDDDLDLGGEDVEAETEVEADEPEHTFDDIVKAFQKYAAKKGRPAAGKVLQKFAVKSVKDLKQKQYSDVMELIG